MLVPRLTESLTVLGLYKVISKHSSKNIAAILLKIFKDYGISGNIGYFIANNTKSNNTCIKVILYVGNISRVITWSRVAATLAWRGALSSSPFLIRRKE